MSGRGREARVELTELAAGGDAVGRDGDGRVTFVPRGAPGDLVRVRLVRETSSFARGVLREVLRPGPVRVAPACPAFDAPVDGGCGGCAWLHVSRPAQLAAKQALVERALRGLVARGLRVQPLEAPAPALGWRRRARLHVVGGRVGLYALSSHRVVEAASCAQLEPGLDAARAAAVAARPPDGELHLLRGAAGEVVIALVPADRRATWPGAEALVGVAGIVGVAVGERVLGARAVEVEPGLWGEAASFAQASAAGNAALVATVRAAVGRGPGALLELHAGSGNLTRGLLADGWQVHASDVVAPSRPVAHEALTYEVGAAEAILAGRLAAAARVDVVVLDPPRTGAAELVPGLIALAAPRIVVVSCDAATLARDAARLCDAGYVPGRAWPLDLMPQTAHVEVVLELARAPA